MQQPRTPQGRPVQGRPPTREEIVQQQKVKAARDLLMGWGMILAMLAICCCCSSTVTGVAVYLLNLPY